MAKQRKNNSTQAPAKAGAGLKQLPDLESELSSPNDNNGEVINKLPTLVLIENFLNKNYCFRKNIVTSRIEFKAIKAAEYSLLDDFQLNSIYRKIKLNLINTNIGELRSIINSDFIKEYDPFVSYFENLPNWDGSTDHIAQLAALVDTTNNDLFQKTFKKWLVALVAGAVNPEIVNHTVLVLSGKQGVGKSTFVLNLLPLELRGYLFSGFVNPKSKDSLIQLSECLLINMDELESLNRGEVGDLKELITKNSIRVRRAYGFHSENLIRRASFSGSVNDKEFLKDGTGNRRFLCHEILAIDYNTPIQHELVYSQAFTLFKSGFKYWFDKEEIEEISLHNEEFQSLTFEEELLQKFYEPIPENESKLFLSTTDIASNLAEHQKFLINNKFKNNLGKALAKHKFARVKKNGRYVYALKNKSIPLSTSFSLAGVKEN